MFQVIGWVPGDNLAYVDGVVGIQMFEMMRSEFLANPATGGGLADAAGYDERIRLLDGWHWQSQSVVGQVDVIGQRGFHGAVIDVVAEMS